MNPSRGWCGPHVGRNDRRRTRPLDGAPMHTLTLEVEEAKRRLTSDVRGRLVPPAGAEGEKQAGGVKITSPKGFIFKFLKGGGNRNGGTVGSNYRVIIRYRIV